MAGFAICLSLLWASVGCTGRYQSNPENLSKHAEFAPRTIRLPPLLVDDKPNLEYDVPVKNETERLLRFASIRHTCSCAGTPRLGAMELSPGEETSLHFDIDLRHRKGTQRFAATLIDEHGAEWTFTLETMLYQRIAFAETGSIHFGMVDPGEEVVKETYLLACAKNREALPDNVSVTPESTQLTVECAASVDEALADGIIVRKTPIKLLLKAPRTPGLATAAVRAKITWTEETKEIQTSADWNVRTLFSVAPAQVYFGQVDPAASEPIQRRVLLQRSDKQPIVVKSIRTTCPHVRCATEPFGNGKAAQLVFALDPKSVTKALWGEVVVETDHPIQATIKIPVAALSKLGK